MRLLLTQAGPYSAYWGGASKSNRLLLEALAERHHDCTVVAPAGEPLGAVRRVTDRHVESFHKGVRIFAVHERSQLHACLRDRIEQCDPAWVLVSSEDAGQALLQVAVKTAPGRIVYLARTTMALPFGPGAAVPSARGTMLLRRATSIIVKTDQLKEYCRRWGEMDAAVLPMSLIDVPANPRAPCFDSGYITMLNPCAVKGISIFVELAKRLPSLQFAAVPAWGTTDADRAQLQALPNVRLLPPDPDIDTIFAQTRILLVPSLWAETGARCVLEAHVRGIPVLASDVGGMSEVMAGMDYLLPVTPIASYLSRLDERSLPVPEVPAQDVELWLTALRAVATDRLRFEDLSRSARIAARGYLATFNSVAPIERHLETLRAERAAIAEGRVQQSWH